MSGFLVLVVQACLLGGTLRAQEQHPQWQTDVRKYAEAREWDAAMKIVDREAARAPQDMDVRAWRARVLTWSGRLAEAENEYLEILRHVRNDPDNWMGLASVYLREGRTADALRALDRAEELDPKRADLRAARGRVLRGMGEREEARSEFQSALNLDPSSVEARAGLVSVRGEPKHELRFAEDNDVLNYASTNRDGWVTLVSQWTAHWATSVAGSFYDRNGTRAGKFSGALTARSHAWGALTAGGSVGHDQGVIPKSEAFFDLDHGWKTGETSVLRGMEFVYSQHWYWYQASRILTLSGTTLFNLPREIVFSVGASGVRSAFSGTGAEWKPAGITRLSFPLAHSGERRLSGNIFYAVGSEDFAQVDQIGRFASQTYGGGLRFQVNARQDITGYGSYQKRTQDRTDTAFGLSYGIHF